MKAVQSIHPTDSLCQGQRQTSVVQVGRGGGGEETDRQALETSNIRTENKKRAIHTQYSIETHQGKAEGRRAIRASGAVGASKKTSQLYAPPPPPSTHMGEAHTHLMVSSHIAFAAAAFPLQAARYLQPPTRGKETREIRIGDIADGMD